MDMTVLERLVQLLERQQVQFERLEHPAVFTSEEVARVRGTSLASGAKALICKADQQLVMFVIPADRRLDSRAVRRALGVRQLRFATPDEVRERTGLRPGSIPPFGSLFDLMTFCDEQLAVEPRINFNAGDHCVSIRLDFADYARVEVPSIGNFTGGKD